MKSLSLWVFVQNSTLLEREEKKRKSKKDKEKKYKEKKCKGIQECVVKKSITFADYKQCLFSGQKQNRSMNLIRSHHHEIYSETVDKVALSCEDDKRIILDDNVHTLAIGHWGAAALER